MMIERYGGFQKVADSLTEVFKKPCNRQQVHTWYERRHRNGFPDYDHLADEGENHRPHGMMFDIHKVLTWYANYIPDRGGRKQEDHGNTGSTDSDNGWIQDTS